MRIPKSVVVATALIAGPALQLDAIDGTEPGDAPMAVILAFAVGFLLFFYFAPIALSLRDTAPWSHVGVVVLAIGAGHLIAIISLGTVDNAIGVILGYAATSAAATWLILRPTSRTAPAHPQDLEVSG